MEHMWRRCYVQAVGLAQRGSKYDLTVNYEEVKVSTENPGASPLSALVNLKVEEADNQELLWQIAGHIPEFKPETWRGTIELSGLTDNDPVYSTLVDYRF